MEIEWKNIEGYENYEVSTCGQIRNKKTNKILKPMIRSDYCRVELCGGIDNRKQNVHCLVASAFIPNPDNKSFVDHIDGNRQNNNINNLRWASSKENNMNRRKRENSVSKYKGVTWHRNKWEARIMINGHRKYLGGFDTERDAGLAYNIASERFFGEYAKLNVIEGN